MVLCQSSSYLLLGKHCSAEDRPGQPLSRAALEPLSPLGVIRTPPKATALPPWVILPDSSPLASGQSRDPSLILCPQLCCPEKLSHCGCSFSHCHPEVPNGLPRRNKYTCLDKEAQRQSKTWVCVKVTQQDRANSELGLDLWPPSSEMLQKCRRQGSLV